MQAFRLEVSLSKVSILISLKPQRRNVLRCQNKSSISTRMSPKPKISKNCDLISFWLCHFQWYIKMFWEQIQSTPVFVTVRAPICNKGFHLEESLLNKLRFPRNYSNPHEFTLHPSFFYGSECKNFPFIWSSTRRILHYGKNLTSHINIAPLWLPAMSHANLYRCIYSRNAFHPHEVYIVY